MMHMFGRFTLLAAASLLLSSCFLTPGKFTSKLVVNADRSFTFGYQGEVIALDLGNEFGKSTGDKNDADDTKNFDPPVEGEETEASFLPVAWAQDESPATAEAEGDAAKDTAAQEAEKDRKLRAVADALRKEQGYRSVEYVGKGKFVVDYQISGTLTHSFIFPFNIDAEAVFPFLAIELRNGGMVRVKAPAFGNDSGGKEAMGGMGGSGSDPRKAVDGSFTLETDAEIVSQNNEDGATTTGARKTIVWKVTPLTKDAPTAVLKLAR